MRRSSLPRGTVVTPGPAEEPPEELLSDFFDIFRLAAWTHGPLSNALEPLATLLAAVIRALHPIIIELDIHRSTDCTHLASPGERWEAENIKPYRGSRGRAREDGKGLERLTAGNRIPGHPNCDGA
jgi:hypothetical protein